MKVIVLSGGAGKRLWPLSQSKLPKQFLPLFEKEDTGEIESIFQRNLRLLSEQIHHKDLFVSTNSKQVDEIRRQVSWNLEVIVEPERRDTFPAIALACVYLHSVKSVDLNEQICIYPADIHVDREFIKAVTELEYQVNWKQTPLLLIGIKPTEAVNKYGYILSDDSVSSSQKIKNIKQFVEKPDLTLAKKLIQQKALWNSGVFIFSLEFMINYLKENGYPSSYQELWHQYSKLPQNSIDYEVIEKTAHCKVLPFEGHWADIGSWDRLTDLLGKSKLGKHINCRDVDHVNVINMTEQPIICIGVSNLIIAASEQGILVTDRSKCDLIKGMIHE